MLIFEIVPLVSTPPDSLLSIAVACTCNMSPGRHSEYGSLHVPRDVRSRFSSPAYHLPITPAIPQTTMGDVRTVYQPIHPEMLPKLDAEYVAFNNANTQYAPWMQDLPWDPAIRKNPPVAGGSEPLKVGSVRDIPMSKCTVRVFTPEGAKPSTGWPVFIFFHGGECTVYHLRVAVDDHA